MALGIFSTYRTGENRVTASLLAVLRSLSIDRMQRIVGAMLGETSTQIVSFKNQIAAGTRPSIPDAEIRGNYRLLIETKTTRDGVRKDQISDHLDRLEEGRDTARLLVLTPDAEEPSVVTELAAEGQKGAGRLVWQSFAELSAAFDEMLADPQEAIGEREAFLVRELQAMFEADGLLGQPENVLVVAASRAWPFYKRHGFYTCQADRGFRPVEFMAFYASGHIQTQVARIIRPSPADAYDAVDVESAVNDDGDGWLSAKLRELESLEPGALARLGVAKVIRLSPPLGEGEQESAGRTIRLHAAIRNDNKNRNDGATAFTMGHRYVRLDRLRNPKAVTTSDVVGDH